MGVILETNQLCKFYGTGENQVKAVNHVNIQIEQGEFVAIVGKSGSGKSTLLHMLGGLDTPTSGSVILSDKDLYSMKEDQLAVFRRRKIGFVFQAFNLVSSINVWENIVLPLGLDGKKVDKAYVNDIITTPVSYTHLDVYKRQRETHEVYALGEIDTREAILLFNDRTRLTAENTIEYMI